jgi:hypothetical protein
LGTWLHSLGDIHVSTILAVVGGAIAILFGVVVLIWLLEFSELMADYHLLGHSWLRALRLALADCDTERIRKHQQRNPSYTGQPFWFAATPAQRAMWAKDLEQDRHSTPTHS